MKKVISLVLLCVSLAFVARTLFSDATNGNFVSHSSELKSYFDRSYNVNSYVAWEGASVKKIQNNLPFNAKTKILRTGFLADVIRGTISTRHRPLLSYGAICVKTEYSCKRLYLRNCSLLI